MRRCRRSPRGGARGTQARRYAVLAGAALGAWPIAARAQPAEPAPVLYLNFSDGAEALSAAAEDDAAANRSSICAAAPFGRWTGAAGCGSRAACQAAIADAVAAIWRDFDVEIVTRRPAHGPYIMAMIGPASGGCAFGVAGAARLDCENRTAADVVFAFECGGAVADCAKTVSQEVAHALGLAHTWSGCDVMAPGPADGCAEVSFVDEDSPVMGTSCRGRPLQNSHRLLAETVGLWPPGRPRTADWREPPPGGCSLAPRTPDCAGPMLAWCWAGAFLALARWVVRRRRRRRVFPAASGRERRRLSRDRCSTSR